MCRIAGIIDRSKPFEMVQNRVNEMCDLQKHGGPDGEGRFICKKNGLVFGHRRLALIELSALGHQPMHYLDRYVITFNGEIYNFIELKEELKLQGFEFKTHSDTEIILAAFARWKTQSFVKLKGMFAFALWDKIEESLYLVRDPSGIKPLYYNSSGAVIEFASEIRAFNYKGNSYQSNPAWPVYQLAYGHIPEPITTIKNIKPLQKGCFIQYIPATGKTSLQSFAFYSYNSSITDRDLAITAVKKGVDVAVGKHLLSDAPIGVFLSGGIDSSIITSVASNYQHQHLKTLSLYFKEAAFSEKAYQDILIKQLDCRYYQHLLHEKEFESSFAGILNDMDMPSCDGINTWFISKYAAAQGLKAVLSGIGGDELFGGYPSFDRMKIAGRLQQLPGSILASGKNIGNKKINRLSYLQLSGVKGLYLFLRGQFTPLQIAQQLNATEKEIWDILKNDPIFPDIENLDVKNEASWMETNMYMQNQLLRDADVMSMAHGVEIRVPFLDDKLIKTALSVAPSIKYTGFPKQLLVDAYKQQLPNEIFNRKKMGFSFPFTEWLTNSEYVKAQMADSSGVTLKNYQKFLAGKLHWSNMMSLILLRKRGAA